MLNRCALPSDAHARTAMQTSNHFFIKPPRDRRVFVAVFRRPDYPHFSREP
jgi:hypothetical protein